MHRRLPLVWLLLSLHSTIACGQSALPSMSGGTGSPVALQDASLASPDIEAVFRLPVSPASAQDPPALELDPALEARIRNLAWSVGDLRLTPYGAFWGDMVYATRRTNPGAYTLWVDSPETEGEPAFTLDARRTRLGLNVTGPQTPWLGNANGSGQVEIDFEGGFVTENRAGLLLRQAYWQLQNPRFRLLAGQTWDVISPLQPGMVDYGIGYAAGNIGFRRSQLRGEWFVPVSAADRLVAQFSLNQPIVSDFPTDAEVRRESGSWPVLEGRLAVEAVPGGSSNARQLGVSGHIGETGFDFLVSGPPPLNLPPRDDARFLTWSLNVDWRLPLHARGGFQGELFMGSNLSAFLGGIGQGVCPCDRRSIRSRGGWFEFWYDATDRWHFHSGAGLDDPIDRDFELGRTYNHFLFANVQLDVTPQLTMGLEVTVRKTLYQDTREGQVPDEMLGPREPGNAVTLDWMARYAF